MAGGKWAGRGDPHGGPGAGEAAQHERGSAGAPLAPDQDRKSTRLNSSHSQISYAVFCLKKKKHRQLYPDHSLPGTRPPSSSTFGTSSLRQPIVRHEEMPLPNADQTRPLPKLYDLSDLYV